MTLSTSALAALTVLTVALIVLVLVRPAIMRHRVGRLLIFVVFLPLPLLVTTAGTQEHIEHSKSTQFCLSCHVMEDYGESLHINDSDYLPAVHFQNRLVSQDKACFDCHTTYTMYGDMRAKLRGLRHVWVYYAGEIPEQIELYEPYENRECLHCHTGGRRFEQGEDHVDFRQELESGETSCLECHEWVHAVDELADLDRWEP